MKTNVCLANLKDCLLDCLFYAIISMIWYKNLLFRCIPNLTYTESKWLLWLMIGVSILAYTLILDIHKWTGWTVVKALSIPYGVYTVIVYSKTVSSWMTIVFVAASIIAISYSILLLLRKIKNRKNKAKIIKHRLQRCSVGTQSIATVALLLVMGIVAVNGVFGNNILNSAKPAIAHNQSNPQTISNNIDTVLLLQEDKWSTLTTQEKLDTLQTVANIEANYLGLPNELNVGAANLDEDTLACYDDSTHTISIDLDHLENDSAYDVLKSCCHEAYHSYQHRLVDAYNASDEQLRELRLFKAAARYSNEFDGYADGDNDFYTYYFQDCEIDARDYAIDAVEDYYNRIDEYLKEMSTN